MYGVYVLTIFGVMGHGWTQNPAIGRCLEIAAAGRRAHRVKAAAWLKKQGPTKHTNSIGVYTGSPTM